MAEPLDPKNVDKRTYARYVRSGLLDEKAYDKHVKGLPDATEKSLPVDTHMADDDFELDDEGDEDVAGDAAE